MPVSRQVDCFKSSQSCPVDRVVRHLKLLHHVLCRWTQDLVLDNCAVSFTLQSPVLKLKHAQLSGRQKLLLLLY